MWGSLYDNQYFMKTRCVRFLWPLEPVTTSSGGLNSAGSRALQAGARNRSQWDKGRVLAELCSFQRL